MMHPVLERAQRARQWREHCRKRAGVRRHKSKDIFVETVITRCCEYFGIDPDDMNSQSRQTDILYARSLSIYLSRELTGRSYPAIGRSHGGRDHSTAMNAHRKIAEQILKDPRGEAAKDVAALTMAVRHGW